MAGLLEDMLNSIPASSPGDAMQDHVREVKLGLTAVSFAFSYACPTGAYSSARMPLHQVADQVVGLRPRVRQVAESAVDERVLMAALALHDQVDGVLMRNDQLIAAASTEPDPSGPR
eukprot:scaffold84763_cov37-Prasinocladus_malaysianus.AAC.1